MYRVKQGFTYLLEDRWKWWVWIEAAASELDQIDQVVYTLHPTFPKPVRIIKDRSTNFKLETSGWGTFDLFIDISLKTGKHFKLTHRLHLEYPSDSNDDRLGETAPPKKSN